MVYKVKVTHVVVVNGKEKESTFYVDVEAPNKNDAEDAVVNGPYGVGHADIDWVEEIS